MKWPSVNPLLLKKNSFMIPFLFTSCFRAHPITILLKILGADAWGVPPPQIFGGPSLQPSLSLRPCVRPQKDRETPMHLSVFTTFSSPPNLGFPTKYFCQVYTP